MLNSINHAREPAAAQRYGGEPYVLAGDVSSHPMHAGRAGWTWYTGSASWMYRAGLEGIVWTRGTTRWEIEIENPEGANRGVAFAELDGRAIDPQAMICGDDGGRHRLRIVLGTAVADAVPARKRRRLAP